MTTGPYDRRNEQHWKMKSRDTPTEVGELSSSDPHGKGEDAVHIERIAGMAMTVPQHNDKDAALRMSDHHEPASAHKRLASKIVTPTADAKILESYVTVRAKGIVKSLSFSREDGEGLAGDDQMIGALNDMDIDPQGDGMMENEEEFNEDFDDDDLLGVELLEAEASRRGSREPNYGKKSSRSKRQGSAANAPLGIKNKKYEFLRRDSPSNRSKSGTREARVSRKQARQGTLRIRDTSSTHEQQSSYVI
ncbi:unnamed protein product [Eruca vesicaria subsp. sativa]|uniref:Uncharacterized protein n=1 Tax=Eruca vesicaria subsp. sativa TaxID=29727 RepID=A0ABC8K7M0_ERUVS|nr:unnamed protein product [Eruca vesicaria subsp. sativa]